MNIVIFGQNSYIGQAFARNAPPHFHITAVSSRDDAYRMADWSGVDCVLFCAGIAHRKTKAALHFAVNCDLAVAVAEHADAAGVPHFVYLSSAAALSPNRKNAYGQSKRKAETQLARFDATTVVRPPMVYGEGCKGNFPKLMRLARTLPFFPDYPNRRAMVSIENLCAFLVDVVQNRTLGTFFPQNAEPVRTADLVRHINPVMRMTRLFNPFIPLFLWVPPVGKLFGDFLYNGDDSVLLNHTSFEDSIRWCTPLQ